MAGHLTPSHSNAGLPDLRPGVVAPQVAQPPLPPVEAGGDGVNWGRYVSALRRYRWLMLIVVLVGTAGGVIATRFIPPEYLVRATIYIEPGPSKAGPIRPPGLLNESAWLDLLRTDAVFDPVVMRLKLYLDLDDEADSVAFRSFTLKDKFRTGDYQVTVSPNGRQWTLALDGSDVASGTVGDSVGTGVGFGWAPTAKELGKNRKIKFTLVHPRAVSADLMLNLRTKISEEGNFLQVGLAGPDKDRLAGIVNAICDEFVAVAADLKKRKLIEQRMALDSQVTIAYQNLRNAEAKLQGFRINTITEPNDAAPVPTGLQQTQGTVTGQYFQQRMQLEAIQQDRKAIEDVLARSESGAITVDAFQTIGSVRQAPDLLGSLNELSKLEADVRALRYRYTDEYKGIQNDLAAINTLRTTTIPAMARALIDQLKVQERDLNSRIKTQGTELQKVPERQITEMRLNRDMQAAEQLFNMLNGRFEEAKLAEQAATNDLSVIDPAKPPQKPTSNSAIKIILMALFGSLGLAVALALALDQIDRRFRYPEQVTQDLGLSILGAIPAIRKTRSGEIAPEEAAQVVEAFRTVRLNLAHSYGAAGPVMLTVSSPGAGDGKSLVSSNLAISFAEAGYSTLLIDGDIRRGELHRMFSIDRRPGMLDYLTGAATLDDIVRPTSHRGLHVIPCGTRRHQGPELLGSGNMGQLLAEVKSRYNVVILDSPPLGAGIDPFVLGTVTGNMLLVLRSGETDRQLAETKLRLLDRLPVRVLGAVLNDIQAQGVYRYYSYLYGYSSDEEMGAPQLTSEAQASVNRGS